MNARGELTITIEPPCLFATICAAAARKVVLVGVKALDFMLGMEQDDTNGPGLVSLETKSGVNGVFHFSDIYPSGFYALRVSPDMADSTTRLIDAQPNPGETVDLGLVMLQ